MATTVEVPVPDGIDADAFRRYLTGMSAHRSAISRIAAVMEQQDAEVGPATAAQLASVGHLRRHLIDRYGIYRAADIAAMRGAKPTNRSVATNLAKRTGLLGFMIGRAKVYPAFQFAGNQVHPNWAQVSRPLIEAGWDEEDVLLWMVSANVVLGGREPAALIDTDDADAVRRLVEEEAKGAW